MSDSYRLSARDIDASIRVVVTASNAGGSGKAKSRAVGPVGPSLKRVRAALAKLLATTKRSTITRLLGNRSWRGSFGAPSSGRLSIAFRAGPTTTLVASARRHFSKAGGRRITVRLTRSGRRLLKGAARLTFGVHVAYVPVGGPAVRSFKRLRLRLRGG